MTSSLPHRDGYGARLLCVGVLVAACLVLGACTHGDEGASLERSVATPAAQRSRMMALAPGRAEPIGPIVSLPVSAGEVQSVRARDYVDGLRQDVLLEGGAVRGIQNSLTVLARTDRRETLDERVPLFKPTEAAIRSEIGGQFPHVAMQVVERDSHNDYGPYGLALGRVGGDVRCLYMWQWIDANRLPPNAGLPGPLSVRVRLCRAGTTFDALAALVDHLAVGPTARAETVADAGQAAAIEVTAPKAATVDTPVSKAEPTAVRHRKKAVRRHAEDRRASGQPPIEASPGAPRFMAPTMPSQEPRQQSADISTSSGIASDLPPEAYLGPKASKPY